MTEPTQDTKKQKVFSRVKTPTVLQMEAVECGAASLAIVLGYFDSFYPLEELRIECGVSRDGSKASNVMKAARKYGLEAKGYRKEPEALKYMQPPMIIHWNFNHFLVLEGFKGNKVFLNDPAAGPRTVLFEDFNESFTGVVLTFNKGPDYKPGGHKKSMMKALGRRIKNSKAAALYAFIAGLALVVPGLVIPVFSRVFVDNILVGRMSDWLMPLLLGMGITAILRGVLTWLQRYYLLRFETKLSLSTSAAFLWHIMRLPVEFFSQRYSGEIGDRVQTNDVVANLLSEKVAGTFIDAIMVVFYAVLMLQYDIVLTTIGISIAVANVLFMRFVSRKRVDASKRLLMDRGKLAGTSMAGLQLIETLKAGGNESDFFEKWSGYQAKLMNSEQELSESTQILTSVPELLTTLNNAIILAVGGFRVMDGFLTMGMLVAFQSLMTSFMEPVNSIVSMGSTLQEIEGSMNRLDDVLNYPVDDKYSNTHPLEKEPSSKLQGYVELKNISFGYSRLEAPLIENLNLSLKPGSRVALVGGSGSGKSTIAKIIAGLYKPWGGEILFDGRRPDEISREVLNNSLAVVDQDISMFEGTVRSNLALWDSTVSETSIIQAAKDAAIHDDISSKAGGYDYNLEEGSKNLSGGQRQRLEIARALVNNPSVLILDEATSALDPITEKNVDHNLRKRGCTCIIVAHRLSTIRDCDEIIVLDRGKVTQRGTHDELKEAGGLYAELIQAH